MCLNSEYGWPSLPEQQRDLPVVLLDVDGTVRGDVLPMVKLARPLVPNFLAKVMFHEPLNAYKLFGFFWNLARLWTLRTANKHKRNETRENLALTRRCVRQAAV